MNGIALLLIAATLGVEYDWGTTDDGQIEYVLIVEPEFISALADGSEIRSSVPPELESVQRLCIRIAQPPAKPGAPPPQEAKRRLPADSFRNSRIGLRAAEPVTILWKALGKPEENQNVKYGWQPTKDGLQEYFVQIDPKLIRSLAPGDEIYTTLAAEAGRADTFVVFSNTRQLPKVAGKPAPPPAAAPLGSALTGNAGGSPAAGNTGYQPAPFTAPGSFSPAPLTPAGNNASPATFGPPAPAPYSADRGLNAGAAAKDNSLYPPPRTFSTTDDPIPDPNSRVNPAGGYGPAQPSATDNTRGFQWDNDRMASTSPAGASNGLNPNGLNQPAANSPYRNDAYGANPSPPNTTPPGNDPFRRNLSPPVDPRNDAFGNNNYAANQPNQPPSAGSAPYRPSVGYPHDNGAANRGYNDVNLPATQPQADYRTPIPDNQFASVPNGSTLRPSLRDNLTAGTLPAAPPAEKPVVLWVLLVFGLLFSLGGNLYLGWTAAEFYSRYRLAVERLRTSGGRT